MAQPSVALFATAQAGVAWVEPANLPFLLSPQPDAAPRAAAPRSLASLRTLSQNLSFLAKKTWKRELARSFCKVNEVETGILKRKLKSYVFILTFQPTITICFLATRSGIWEKVEAQFFFDNPHSRHITILLSDLTSFDRNILPNSLVQMCDTIVPWIYSDVMHLSHKWEILGGGWMDRGGAGGGWGGYHSDLKPKKGADNHAYLGDHSLRLDNIQDIVTL